MRPTQDDDSATRDKILRHTTRPVLLIPEAGPDAPLRLGRTVLIAYDGSAAAEHSLTSFARSGLAEGRDGPSGPSATSTCCMGGSAAGMDRRPLMADIPNVD
jgi:hypothetical protein